MTLGAMGVSSTIARPAVVPRQFPICRICDALSARRLQTAKSSFPTQSVSRPRPRYLQRSPAATIRLSDGSCRPRWLAAPLSTRPRARSPTDNDETGTEKGAPVAHASNGRSTSPNWASRNHELSSLTSMMAYLENSKSKVVAHRNIPSEADCSAALQACKVVADYLMDESVQPQISHMVSELDSTASNLLSLDSSRASKTQSSSLPESSGDTRGGKISAQLQQMIDKTSDTAYACLAHPAVFITPRLLRQYVDVQARLGKPETLPNVFQLYASKPAPRESTSGPIRYVKQDPDKAANAIDSGVVETALDTAIEAKNLDAAVGIIENSYNTKAFTRSKLLRKALIPSAAFAATPMAAYILASNFSGLQESMDASTATGVAFVGICAYVGFTASIGIVALTTANDQMKRVSWAPGIPLRQRWLREEERAALDKICCEWGYKETWRQGEEEGADWDALREYIGHRGMIVDRTELLEGMD